MEQPEPDPDVQIPETWVLDSGSAALEKWGFINKAFLHFFIAIFDDFSKWSAPKVL